VHLVYTGIELAVLNKLYWSKATMASINIWAPIAYFFCLFAVTFGAIRFLRGLRKDALTNKEVRLFQVLVIVWLFLMAGHGSALIAAGHSTSTALPFWMLVNVFFAGLFLTQYRPLPAKTLGVLLWCAIAVCGALLVTWPLALGVAAIPLTLPVDLTLGVSAVIAVILAVLILLTPWKAPRTQGGKSSAKRENVQQNANHL